jgi:hypothetical protein
MVAGEPFSRVRPFVRNETEAQAHSLCLTDTCIVVLLLLLFLELPLPNAKTTTGMPVALVGHNVTQLGLRPPWVPGVSSALKQLVEECWAQNPDDRCVQLL